ncbi:MAG: phosphatase PAP2 family protein [Candidatus Eisenbacteria bacterium]|nr:phosphatase PAP2 family protein [Candidatus Eisenbacteria bacterium]
MNRMMLALLLGAAFLAPLDSLDRRIRSEVQAGRRPALERPMQLVSNACNPTTLSAGLLALALLGGPAGVEVAREAVIALIPVNIVVEGTKRITNRERPDGERRRSNAAFPSSHVANAFAIAAVLARRWRSGALWFLVAAALVGFSRVYLNRHWASDVVVGAALGAVLAWRTARWLEQRRGGRGFPRTGPGSGA